MNEKQLSKAEIERLFQFMQEKYVRHYDVQIELVDHFASAIEEIWKKYPTMSFERAIAQVYSGFPLTGFYHLIEQKRAAIMEKIRQQTWKYVKGFLQLPKIMATFLAITLFYLFYSTVSKPLWFAVGILLVVFFAIIYLVSRFKKDSKNQKKQFLSLETLTVSHTGVSFFFGMMPQLIEHNSASLPFWGLVVLSIFTVALILVSIGHYKVANSIYQDCRRQFPQYV